MLRQEMEGLYGWDLQAVADTVMVMEETELEGRNFNTYEKGHRKGVIYIKNKCAQRGCSGILVDMIFKYVGLEQMQNGFFSLSFAFSEHL